MSGPERRAGILAASRPLFARHGFDGVATADIARAAGCSEAVLYRHFASKQALFAAVVDEASSRILARLRAVSEAGGGDPFGALVAHARLVQDDPDYGEITRLRALAVAMADDPEVRPVLRGMAQSVHGLLCDAVARSQAAGHLRRDVAPEHVARLFSGLSFIAAFVSALEGPDGLGTLAPAVAALAHLLRPAEGGVT